MWLLNFFGLVTRKEYDTLKVRNKEIQADLSISERRYRSFISNISESESPTVYDSLMRAALKQLSELRLELAKEKLRNSITDELELLAGLSGESCVTEKMKDAISAYNNMQSFIEEQKKEISKDVEDTERPAVH